MRAFHRPQFWRMLRYRLCVAGVGIAYLLAALDIPLPASVHKYSSQPFPCQDHPCGCQTAEQCWRHCCCYTPEQRWAWARAHGVEPPDYAEKPADTAISDASQKRRCRQRFCEASLTGQGWNTVKLRDRATLQTKTTAKNCCETNCRHSAKSSSDKSSRVRWGSALATWRCQGGSTLWVNVGAVLPVPLPPAWRPDWSPPALLPLPNAFAHPQSGPPLAPPPRLSRV